MGVSLWQGAVMIKTTRVYVCDFCKKTQYEVKRLISADDVMICNECGALCVEIISEAETKEAFGSPATAADEKGL